MRGRRKTVKISDAEWAVMQVLWSAYDEKREVGLTLGEIVGAVADSANWSSTTIRTLVIRLADKGAVTIDKTSGVYKYAPKVDRAECLKEELNTFVKRVFNGSYSDLMSLLVESVSRDEVQSLLASQDAE